jgi:nitroreductase
MDVIEAILNRRSIRNFKVEPVPKEVLTQIIETSKWSPSGSNTQPWEFIVLGGEVLAEVKARLMKTIKLGQGGMPGGTHPDIPYPPMPEPYSGRQRALGKQMQTYLTGVRTQAKTEPRTSAGNFFGAPNAIIVCVDKEISPRAFLGLGMITQTVCLTALNHGLGTCIMSIVAYWPEIYREMFGVPDSKIIAFGIAIGYPDFEAPINNFPRTREALDAFVQWHGFLEHNNEKKPVKPA